MNKENVYSNINFCRYLMKKLMDQKVKDSVEQWAKDNGIAKPNEEVVINTKFVATPINDPRINQKAKELLERLKH